MLKVEFWWSRPERIIRGKHSFSIREKGPSINSRLLFFRLSSIKTSIKEKKEKTKKKIKKKNKTLESSPFSKVSF